MKKKPLLSAALLFSLLFNIELKAQEMGLVFESVDVRMKEVKSGGITGHHRLYPGKTSDWYILYDTDTLRIKAQYKLTANNSGRSQTKDSSVKLNINYTVVYKGRQQERKVEKMFFLDDERKIDGEETFNITLSKYSNSVIRLGYSGRLTD
ncbi:MAG: hypothetical protein ACKOQ6_08560 [Bacteroidota bacterium]